MSPIPARQPPMTRARVAAESLMSLTLTAYSPAGRTTGPDGYSTQAYAAQGSTPGKVQSVSRAGGDTVGRSVEIGGVQRPVLEGGLHIPIAAPVPTAGPIGTGWEYVVAAVGPDDDPALLGRRFLVVAAPVKSFATARRLDVVEL